MTKVKRGISSAVLTAKRGILCAAWVLVWSILTGCAGIPSATPGPDFALSAGRIPVTLLCDTPLPEFETIVETEHPDIDLQITLTPHASLNGDTLRALRGGYGTDLVYTSLPESDISAFVWNLSPYGLPERFDSGVMESVSADGFTGYLPMPGICYGLIVNQTLIERLGRTIPRTQTEFLDMLEAARSVGEGVTEDGAVFAFESAGNVSVGEMILSTAAPDFLATDEGEVWTRAFRDGAADMAGTLDLWLDFFLSLTARDYMDPAVLETTSGGWTFAELCGKMAAEQFIACYGSTDLLKGVREINPDDTFIMLPFLSGTGRDSWYTSAPSAWVGINAALASGDTTESDADQLDAALRVLDTFSTPAGQAALLLDTGADYSCLAQPVPTDWETDNTLYQMTRFQWEAGHVYQMNRFRNSILWAFGRALAGVCAGKTELRAALRTVDTLNHDGPSGNADDHTLIGTAAVDLLYEQYNTRREETAIGNLVADAVAEYTGVDAAFVNGGGIRGTIFAGDVFVSDLAAACPSANTVVILDVTAEVLAEMLSNSIRGIYYNAAPAGRFLQVSHGVSYSISVDRTAEDRDETGSTPARAKLIRVDLPESARTPDGMYRIAVNSSMCGALGYDNGAGDGFTMLNVFSDALPKWDDVRLVLDTGRTYADILIAYFRAHADEPVSAELEGRISVEEIGA